MGIRLMGYFMHYASLVQAVIVLSELDEVHRLCSGCHTVRCALLTATKHDHGKP